MGCIPHTAAMKCYFFHSGQVLANAGGTSSHLHAAMRRTCGFLMALALLGMGAIRAEAAPSEGKSITLAWDPSTGPNVSGYNVYYGTASGSYSKTISSGMATNATITDLTAGVTYYFAATAVDTAGLESAYSNEVEFTMPGTVGVGLAIGICAEGMTLSGPGVPGKIYEIEESADLKTWTRVASATADANGSFQTVQPLQQRSKFFRICGQ